MMPKMIKFVLVFGLLHQCCCQSHLTFPFHQTSSQQNANPLEVEEQKDFVPCEHQSPFDYHSTPLVRDNPCPSLKSMSHEPFYIRMGYGNIQIQTSQSQMKFRAREPKVVTSTTETPKLNARISVTKCEEYKRMTYIVSSFGGMSNDDSVNLELKTEACNLTSGFIVGGVKAGKNEFPHMAAIGYGNDEVEISFRCGGSLISERCVLTAAHCRKFGKIPASAVRLGMTELDFVDAEDYAIEKFLVHERYKSSTKQNDIAIAKLTRDVEFRLPQRIRPSCLWQDEIISQPKTIAIGWGATTYGALGITDELMKVQLDVLDNSLCAENFEEAGLAITDRQVCAGVLAGGKDTCTGDSGGPIQIVLPDNNCMSHIIGITSYGGFCGGRNSPSVYTRVSAHIDWIEEKAWSDQQQI